jgi:hypothetical protein
MSIATQISDVLGARGIECLVEKGGSRQASITLLDSSQAPHVTRVLARRKLKVSRLGAVNFSVVAARDDEDKDPMKEFADLITGWQKHAKDSAQKNGFRKAKKIASEKQGLEAAKQVYAYIRKLAVSTRSEGLVRLASIMRSAVASKDEGKINEIMATLTGKRTAALFSMDEVRAAAKKKAGVSVNIAPPLWLKAKGYEEQDWHNAVLKAEQKGLLKTGKEFGLVVRLMKSAKLKELALKSQGDSSATGVTSELNPTFTNHAKEFLTNLLPADRAKRGEVKKYSLKDGSNDQFDIWAKKEKEVHDNVSPEDLQEAWESAVGEIITEANTDLGMKKKFKTKDVFASVSEVFATHGGSAFDHRRLAGMDHMQLASQCMEEYAGELHPRQINASDVEHFIKKNEVQGVKADRLLAVIKKLVKRDDEDED